MKRIRPLAAAGTCLVVAAALTACGSPTPDAAQRSPSASTSVADPSADADAHNAADTEFAQMMIVHHQGAVQMAQRAATNGGSLKVQALGQRIAAAQKPEIDLMSSWLGKWGEEQPSDAVMGSMDHGSLTMDGMDQDAVMGELSGLQGADFDRRFLKLMTDHHRGAIQMAEKERAAGRNTDALALSRTIIDAQTAEITEMDNLLAAP